MIKIDCISKSYGKKSVLKNITTHLSSGNVYALMGPNGSGKTTLLKIILGLVKQDSGIVTVQGENTELDCMYRNKMGYMPQSSSFPENLTVREVISMLKDLKGKQSEIDEELFRQLQIDGFSSSQISKLSGGMKQRLSCATAFMFSPDIIILDEPTSGLDPVSSEIVRQRIKDEKKKGRLIIITTHITAEAEETADRLIYLLDGEIYFDSTIEEVYNKTGQKKLSTALAHKLSEIYKSRNYEQKDS